MTNGDPRLRKISSKIKLRIAAFFSLVLGFLAYPFSVYLFPYVLLGESTRLSDGTRVVTSPEVGGWILKLGAILLCCYSF